MSDVELEHALTTQRRTGDSTDEVQWNDIDLKMCVTDSEGEVLTSAEGWL